MLLKLGQAGKAAELFLKAEDNEKAALAFEQAGDTVRAATLRGEQAFKTDKPAEAAAWFVKGRDFLRAAELYESVGMMAEAAGAYEAGESWAAAGGVYIRAGLKDKAAAAYEKAGELETAASLYQELGNASRAGDLYGRAGHAFKSGEAAARAGEREKAIALLQRVPPSDENHRAATELLARLFIETGRPPLAIERLKKAIGNEPISAANLDFHYWLALAHEAAGARAEALELYKKIQAEDLQYRDVNQRVTKLCGFRSRPGGPARAGAERPRAEAGARGGRAGSVPNAPRAPRFVPKEEIARGPLGAVFRGEDATDGRSVAMRMLNPALLKSAPLVSALGRRAQGGVAALAPQPGQGDRAHGVGGRPLRGHGVRGRSHLRRGDHERPQARLPAGALARPRDRPGAGAAPPEGPRPRLDPSLERDGGLGSDQARRPRPRAPGARRGARSRPTTRPRAARARRTTCSRCAR